MFFTKRRLIHATLYEGILLVVIAIILSHFMHMPLEVTGLLGVAMALTSMIWNMVFNHSFEKIEKKRQWQRTFKVRVLHAIGFEGGLMLATIPMIAYALDLNIWQAIVLDFGLTMGILVYTFIFQWCYDSIEEVLGYQPEHRKI
jgi:uncharacterized membrane protein